MNPRQFATVAAELCGSVVLAGWVVASFAGLDSVGIENTGAISIEDRRAPSLAADAELPDAPRATVVGNAAIANADVATAKSVTGTATHTMAASDKPVSIVVAALADSSQKLPPKTPSVQVATASTPDPVLNDARE